MTNDPYPAGWKPGWDPGDDDRLGGRLEDRLEDRLTHLVLVDGRLVDLWREPVAGTRWQHHADRYDAQLRAPAPPPPPPTYARVLAWLEDRCGGRPAVTALTGDPLLDDGLELPEAPAPQDRERLRAVTDLLAAVTARRLDAETGVALRRALGLVYAVEPEVVLEATTASRVAGGLVWAVGRANGLIRPQGELRMGLIQEELALTSTVSTYGKTIQRALVGYRDPGAPDWWRPDGLPDLLALGHADLLLGSVRRRLVRVRDRALEAEAAAAARVLPSMVE